MLSEGFFDPRKPLTIRSGDLPHWRQEGATYFVTFRLLDSLPQVRLDQLRREYSEWRTSNASPDVEEIYQFTLRRRRKIERWLDQGSGCCLLMNPKAKEIAVNAMRHFDGQRYELGSHAVAANHVHALLRMSDRWDLSEILHSWKRFTAREIGKLGISPPSMREHIWQSESFDHIVRNERGLDRIDAYIRRHLGSPAL